MLQIKTKTYNDQTSDKMTRC